MTLEEAETLGLTVLKQVMEEKVYKYLCLFNFWLVDVELLLLILY